MDRNYTININSTASSTPTIQDTADDIVLRLETVIILTFINSASSLVGTLGNGLVLIALTKDSRLRSSTDFFISSLSVADLLVNALYQPMFVFRVILFQTLHRNSVYRGIMSCVGYLASVASVTSMFVITIDRLVSIARSLHYTSLMTKRVTYVAICVTWAFSLAVSLLYLVVKPHGFYIGTYCTILLIGTIVMYAFILKAAKKQEHKVAATCYQGNEAVAAESGTRRRIRHQKKERKAAKTVAIVIGFFVVCWIPLLIYTLSVSQSTYWFIEGFLWTQTASLCNSFINPYIYCIRSHRYRSAIKRLLGLDSQRRSRTRVKPRSSTGSMSRATADRIQREHNSATNTLEVTGSDNG